MERQSSLRGARRDPFYTRDSLSITVCFGAAAKDKDSLKQTGLTRVFCTPLPSLEEGKTINHWTDLEDGAQVLQRSVQELVSLPQTLGALV